MKTGFIGAGKVGFSLGKFFAEKGVTVTGYFSRHRKSALEAAGFTGTKEYDTVYGLVRDSDVIFLTVPDGEIRKVYEDLKGSQISGKILCHCSGAMTASEAFPAIEETGAYGYSIHPLFPISNKLDSYRELTDAFFCMEGEGPHMGELKAALEGLGLKVRLISSEAKVKYHAACVFSSNLICGLVRESVELLSSCGFSGEDALSALGPLIRSNVEHILKDGPVKALTGPVERCDAETVAEHLGCFESEGQRELYRAASERLVSAAEAKNPDRSYEPLYRLLRRREA